MSDYNTLFLDKTFWILNGHPVQGLAERGLFSQNMGLIVLFSIIIQKELFCFQ